VDGRTDGRTHVRVRAHTHTHTHTHMLWRNILHPLQSRKQPHVPPKHWCPPMRPLKKKSNAIPITGRGALKDCETLRIPHSLDSPLTDGGKVVSPTYRPCSTPQKYYFSASGTHFCQRRRKPQGLVWPEQLGKLKKFIDFVGSRTRNLPACGIVP
jgi:hypothetical protein